MEKIWQNRFPDRRSHYDKFMDRFTGVKTFQIFDDKKLGMPARIIHDVDKQDLMKLNKAGYGIYLTVNETNGKGRKASDVVRVRAAFVDLDGAPINPVLNCSPHLVVETSKDRYHAYFFISDCPLQAFRDCQKSLIKKFSADQAVHDLSRVMRVPGFYHMKKEPYPVSVVYNCPGSLSYMEFIEKFPPLKRKEWSSERYNKTTINQSEYAGPRGVGKGERNASCMKIIGGMLKRGLDWDKIESEVWLHAEACTPPIAIREVEHVLRSGKRYAK